MLTYFHYSFIDILHSKFVIKPYSNTQRYLRHVATLPCEIHMFKNRHVQDVIEANCHEDLATQKLF